MLQKLILLQTLFFCLLHLNAQEWNTMNLRIEIGALDLSESNKFGVFLNVEPKLKASENTIIGLRIGVTANSLTYENHDSTQFVINELSNNGVISIVPTLDYHWDEIKFRPSLGVGIGPYLLVGDLDILRVDRSNPVRDIFQVELRYRIGVLLRAGFNLGKARFGLEYNFVPKTEVVSQSGEKIGTVDRAYLGLSIGFSIGGRKNSW